MKSIPVRFLFTRVLLGIFFSIILFIIIALARGYRVDFSQKTLQPTGIIAASSYPDGAKVYVNGKLKGATNTNISVPPGVYNVEIKEDGYYTWSKTVTVKGELVIKTDALLFPQNPSLSPITSIGVSKAFVSPSGDTIILISETGDQEKDGIYSVQRSRNPLNSIGSAELLSLRSAFSSNIDFTQAAIKFGPDEDEILLSIPLKNQEKVQVPAQNVYLLSVGELTEDPFEISQSFKAIEQAWQEDETKKMNKLIETFKKPFRKIVTDYFQVIAFSPTEEKILYTPKLDTELPLIIKPRLIATNQTLEERTIQKGNIYVYDKKEDKNFKIIPKEEFTDLKNDIKNIMWHPDSQHIVWKENDNITVMDYDGTNNRIVYSGPFEQDFFSITSDGKLLILTNLNKQSNTLPDVYSVGIQ